MKKVIILIFSISVCFSSCRLSENDKLNDSDIEFIKDLGLLENEEEILVFSTSLTKKINGNFASDKRIAAYWIDKKAGENSFVYAYYKDIENIESIDLTETWTYSSYLIITKKDDSKFKVYIDGDKEKCVSFVTTTINTWKEKR